MTTFTVNPTALIHLTDLVARQYTGLGLTTDLAGQAAIRGVFTSALRQPNRGVDSLLKPRFIGELATQHPQVLGQILQVLKIEPGSVPPDLYSEAPQAETLLRASLAAPLPVTQVTLPAGIRRATGMKLGQMVAMAASLVERAAGLEEGDPLRAKAGALQQSVTTLDAATPEMEVALRQLNEGLNGALAKKRMASEAARQDQFDDDVVSALDSLVSQGVITQQVVDRLMAALAMAGAKPRIQQQVKTAVGSLTKPSGAVMARNAVHGALFEISQLMAVRAIWRPGEEVVLPERATGKRGGDAIDNDNPVFSDDRHRRLIDTKAYPRMNWGDPKQLTRYQAAVATGQYHAATYEVSGNIDPAFLEKLADGTIAAPGVELLYTVTLNRGDGPISITAALKPIQLPNEIDPATLERIYPATPDGPSLEDRAIQRGIRAAMAQRSFNIFSNKFLREEDVRASGSDKTAELLQAVQDGAVDPMKISDLAVFEEFLRLINAKRVAIFSELGSQR